MFYKSKESKKHGDSQMKILYGINTNGQGHTNRSRIFINQLLKDGHEVQVLFAGDRKPPKYAFDIVPKTYYRPGPFDIYENHKISVSKTFQHNIVKLGNYIEVRRELIELDSKENFDIFFSDFDQYTCYVGKRVGKPVICINRQSVINHPLIDRTHLKGHEILTTTMIVNAMQHSYIHCFAIDFTQKIETHNDITLFPLIWKPEFEKYDVTTGNHITVYLSWHNPKELVDVFTKFPKETFYVYGFNKNKRIKNVIFKETSRDGFLKDLVSCKGIIGNAGFNLGWEACLLKKFIWMIPFETQYEQTINALGLEKLGQAFISHKISEKNLSRYLNWIKSKNYRPKNNLTILKASDLLNRVYNLLENYNREYYPDRMQLRREIKLGVNRWRMRQEIRKEIKLNNLG
ncbi:MAG: hypothetical protein FK730_03010 [Asgard group archaeon]|nr:hypothetical protein [Asgard group archaeon]